MSTYKLPYADHWENFENAHLECDDDYEEIEEEFEYEIDDDDRTDEKEGAEGCTPGDN